MNVCSWRHMEFIGQVNTWVVKSLYLLKLTSLLTLKPFALMKDKVTLMVSIMYLFFIACTVLILLASRTLEL